MLWSYYIAGIQRLVLMCTLKISRCRQYLRQIHSGVSRRNSISARPTLGASVRVHPLVGLQLPATLHPVVGAEEGDAQGKCALGARRKDTLRKKQCRDQSLLIETRNSSTIVVVVCKVTERYSLSRSVVPNVSSLSPVATELGDL